MMNVNQDRLIINPETYDVDFPPLGGNPGIAQEYTFMPLPTNADLGLTLPSINNPVFYGQLSIPTFLLLEPEEVNNHAVMNILFHVRFFTPQT